jgi:hypothetical protein
LTSAPKAFPHPQSIFGENLDSDDHFDRSFCLILMKGNYSITKDINKVSAQQFWERSVSFLVVTSEKEEHHEKQTSGNKT